MGVQKWVTFAVAKWKSHLSEHPSVLDNTNIYKTQMKHLISDDILDTSENPIVKADYPQPNAHSSNLRVENESNPQKFSFPHFSHLWFQYEFEDFKYNIYHCPSFIF